VPVRDMDASPALQIIGKMKKTLEGRAVAVLVSDGADGELVARLKKAIVAAGASVKIVAPKVAGVRLANGKALAADGQLAGTPSVLFDAVAIIASAAGARELSHEAAAIDFVRDAFGHLKAIAIDEGGQSLLQAAGVEVDPGIIAAHDVDAFVEAAMTRQWQREAKVRRLA
jgi:catalase